jgi:hypothetical protein
VDTQEIQTPKAFYRKERDRLYTQWRSSFWRELFQNSVDAGAKNININIETTRRRSSFFSGGTVEDDIIRVSFDDDGCGMTQRIIDDIYFKPGNTTKDDGNSVGGYGRARLMSNFAQFRFGFKTGTRSVEGDGPRYIHKSLDEMLEALETQSAALELRADEPGMDFCLSEMRSEMESLRSAIDAGGVDGCRMEIDIDPEDGDGSWNKPTVANMTKFLEHYLKTSNVPATVTINGQIVDYGLSTRGMRKLPLSVVSGAGSVDKVFGHAYHTKNSSAPYLRKLLVRVDGATMIEDDLDVDLQVVLEIDRTMSRDVLTSNRDGFRNEYKQAVDEFKQKLILDVRSATDDRKDVVRAIVGEKGRNVALKTRLEDTIQTMPDLPAEVVAPVKVARDEFARSRIESRGYGGVPFEYLEKFFRSASWSAYETFLGNSWSSQFRDSAQALRDATYGKTGADLVATGLETLTEEARGMVLGYLHAELAKNRAEKLEKAMERLKGLNDVVIQVKGNPKGPVRRAIAKYDPASWSEEEGRGRQQKSLLVVWNVICDIAIQHLGEKHPATINDEGLKWTTGWVFSAPESHYRVDQKMDYYMTEALCSKKGRDVDLLLNPVDSDGRAVYDLNDPSDIQKLIAIGCHEVAHIHTSSHNEDFANVLTDLFMAFDHKEANRRISLARKEINRAFKEGRAKMQPMDDMAGSRPSFRLMAAVNPVSAMIAGAARSGLAGDDFDSSAALFESSFRSAADGTYAIDRGQIAEAEEALRDGFTMATESEPEIERSYGM